MLPILAAARDRASAGRSAARSPGRRATASSLPRLCGVPHGRGFGCPPRGPPRRRPETGRGTDGPDPRWLPADRRRPRLGARRGRSGSTDLAAIPRHLPTGHDVAPAGETLPETDRCRRHTVLRTSRRLATGPKSAQLARARSSGRKLGRAAPRRRARRRAAPDRSAQRRRVPPRGFGATSSICWKRRLTPGVTRLRLSPREGAGILGITTNPAAESARTRAAGAGGCGGRRCGGLLVGIAGQSGRSRPLNAIDATGWRCPPSRWHDRRIVRWPERRWERPATTDRNNRCGWR